MDFGVVFPQTEIGPDPEDAKELIQASEQMGFEGLVVYDHVVGANTDFYKNSGIDFFYDIDSNFHEIFVLLGWAAAITQRIKLITGIVILPQRQTTLVAKQAAAIDVLSGGRLVLGIAVGWNPVEFEALGEDFHNRGKRIEEQIDVMRALWTKKVVNYQGRWHTIRQAGIKPFPVQQPYRYGLVETLTPYSSVPAVWATHGSPPPTSPATPSIRSKSFTRQPERQAETPRKLPLPSRSTSKPSHDKRRRLRQSMAGNRRIQILPGHHALRLRLRSQAPGRLQGVQRNHLRPLLTPPPPSFRPPSRNPSCLLRHSRPLHGNPQAGGGPFTLSQVEGSSGVGRGRSC